MTGEIGILNVGAGDTKLVFDKSNPAEMIRAARIVKDMLRRGYALLIEVETGGQKSYRRVTEFHEDTCEYVIADFDPVTAEQADKEEAERAQANQPAEIEGDTASKATRGHPRSRKLAASATRGVAVARTAGG